MMPPTLPMLINTGPLVALIDQSDQTKHQQCAAIFRSLAQSPLTTWPCLTEAFYLLNQYRGWKGQRALFGLITSGAVRVHAPYADEWQRLSELMEQYQDRPMDFADASLVCMAESLGITRIFTLDDDFYFYKIKGRDTFDVLKPDSA
jgi:hypothetical protein